MLSFRVNALLQIGHSTLFSPVCFLPWRAAWPDVVNVAVHPCVEAYGQGYLFRRLIRGVLLVVVVVVVERGWDWGWWSDPVACCDCCPGCEGACLENGSIKEVTLSRRPPLNEDDLRDVDWW